NPYQATGVHLVRGERYAVVATVKEAWKDNHTLDASPAGLEPGWQTHPVLWTSVLYRRVVEAPWYELRGEIGPTGHYPVAIGRSKEFVADESGELFLFVN